MPHRNIIVVGTSSGGVSALVKLVQALPAGFAATMMVVCHFPSGGKSVLPEILSRAGKLLAVHATDGDSMHPGQIYVAPPDWHLVLGPEERMHLTREARENHNRPAVDPLFRSAARHYGPRVIGVVLTGSLYDGSAGLIAIRASGGLAVIQDPRDAQVAAMPQNAINIAGADYVVRADEMAPLLLQLTHEPMKPDVGGHPMDAIDKLPAVVAKNMAEQANNHRRGKPSIFSCPECGGVLWQVDDDLPRFRCHVGHAYNGEALLADQSVTLEAALWSAVRGFREKAVLSRQLEAIELKRGNKPAAERFRDQAFQANQYSDVIVKHVLNAVPPGGVGPADAPVQDSTP